MEIILSNRIVKIRAKVCRIDINDSTNVKVGFEDVDLTTITVSEVYLLQVSVLGTPSVDFMRNVNLLKITKLPDLLDNFDNSLSEDCGKVVGSGSFGCIVVSSTVEVGFETHVEEVYKTGTLQDGSVVGKEV